MLSASLRSSPPPADEVIARIGLIADTHLPARLLELPATPVQALAGVDLILHAGDVGELRVLDELSACAPVIAVHGNDDTPEAQRELPYQQLLTIGGRRLLLTHSHHPRREDELAVRRDDAWAPKLAARAAHARRAGAQALIFGHTHIPMLVVWDELLLLNPGALASGNYLTRQLLCSVARLVIDQQGGFWVEFLNLDRPEQPFVPQVDLSAGFRVALNAVSATIADASVQQCWPRLRALFEPEQLSAAERHALHRVLHHLALPRWNGSLASLITRSELEQTLQRMLEPALWRRVAQALDG